MSDIYDRYHKLKEAYLDQINALENLELLEATDEDLQKKAAELRKKVLDLLTVRYDKLKDSETDLLQESEDLMLDILPEAFALVREVSKRLLGMRHYDVQITAGVALHLGKVTELKNGEGKTIVTLLPAYLNSLFVNAEFSLKSAKDPNYRKRNVHVMTTNPYLARRDYVWLTPVYDFLGVTVGYLQDTHDPGGYAMDTLERKTMYSADVVYGPSKEFVFDYLRDNHADSKSDQVQPSYYFVIVDEVDHVLLDEAETPHILSGKTPTIPNEDLGLVYWTTHLSNRFNASKTLFALSADQTRFALTRTGQDISRIIGKRIINSERYPDYSKIIFVKDTALGAIIQFLEIISYQHSDAMPSSVYGEISKLSRWTKSNENEFYRVSSTGKLLGVSDAFRRQIRVMLDNYLRDDGSFLEGIQLVIKLVQYGLGSSILELSSIGFTPEEARDMAKYALKILPRLSMGEKGQKELFTNWVVEITDYFLVSVARVLAQDPQLFMGVIRDTALFMNAYTTSFNHAIYPDTVLTIVENLQDTSWGQKLDTNTTRSMAPDAFTRVIDIAIVPALVDLMNPGMNRKPTNILLLAFPILFRLIRKIGQIETPRNRVERELFEHGEELARTFNVNVYEVVDPHQEIRLTRWGEMIVDDYAERIIANKLWLGDSLTRNERGRVEELSRRLRFLVNRGLVAYAIYKRNNQYVIQQNRFRENENFTKRTINHEVVIISHLTGRMQAGRRWNQWLHSFIEAKEGLPVKPERKSIGRITMQGYIGMYPKIAGMTGTAHVGTMSHSQAIIQRTVRLVQKIKSILKREPIDMFEEKILTSDPIEDEFENVYETEVVVVPTHREIQREDLPDSFFLNRKARLNAVVKHVLEIHRTDQPILVETTSISQSKEVATAIKAHARKSGKKVNVQLLNALTYEQEAEIISKAGLPGAITVATQMAGRGTDIVIPQESLALGGLYVIGVQRQLQRRWDDQISGRAGRQGEVGASKFFVSLDDYLMKLMNGERSVQWMAKFDLPEDIPIEHKMLDKIVKNNQIQLAHNARSRREKTHGFDRMIAPFRSTIYKIRQQTLKTQYICPLCQSSKIDIANENLYCINCSQSFDKLPESLRVWRNFVERLVSALVDNVIKDVKVEQYLVDKYTSDASAPNEWNWDDLTNELNTMWLHNIVTKETLAKEIDFSNQLYPQEEREKLVDTIRHELIRDARNKLFTDIQNQTLRKFYKRDKNVLNWNLEELNKELREEFHIAINLAKDKSILKPRERRKVLETDIQKAIEQRVSFFDWTYTNAGVKDQIQTTFNTFLHQDDILKREDIDRKNFREEILKHMHNSYMRLIEKYGKNPLFVYENKVVRDAIDEQWQNMLVESELIVEELRGRSTQEILIQYGARIGKLFQRFYGDIAIHSLRMIFVENAEIEITGQDTSKTSARVAGNKPCPCGSNKKFAQCCGNFVHQRMPKIIST